VGTADVIRGKRIFFPDIEAVVLKSKQVIVENGEHMFAESYVPSPECCPVRFSNDIETGVWHPLQCRKVM
jgi:hypothetical protein